MKILFQTLIKDFSFLQEKNLYMLDPDITV